MRPFWHAAHQAGGAGHLRWAANAGRGRYTTRMDVDGMAPGSLGLLAVQTTLRRRNRAPHRDYVSAHHGLLPSPWVHYGCAGGGVRNPPWPHPVPPAPAHGVLAGNLGWCNLAAMLLGVYLHGLFEDAAVLRALLVLEPPPSMPCLTAWLTMAAPFAAGVLDALRGLPQPSPH